MHEDVSPQDKSPEHQAGRYRTVEFSDGTLIFDREDTAGWIYAETVVRLAGVR